MIKNSFCFLPGIGQVRERTLWKAGILCWEDFLKVPHPPGISPSRKDILRGHLSTALVELEKRNHRYFAGLVERREHWRLFREFSEDAVYLDIETTGLSPDYCDITMVGIYRGGKMTALILGEDLTEETLEREVSHCKMLVTYYGTAFDLPFLLRKFPGLRLNEALHFDLCFGARRLGLTGGLKAVEAKVGITRREEVVGIDGFEAVRLWNDYQRGDTGALKLLMAYNEEDTRNLTFLAPILYDRLRDRTGIDAFIPECRTPPPAHRRP